jgi:hypothetical protein
MLWLGLKTTFKHGLEPSLSCKSLDLDEVYRELKGFPDLTTEHFCESLETLPSLLLTASRDAVATDIIHQHSGRLDYYKGSVFSRSRYNHRLKDTLETSPNSTRPSLSATKICARSTTPRWSTASICKRSLIDGVTTPTAVGLYA